MKTTKLLSVIFLIIAVVTLLAACSDSNVPASDDMNNNIVQTEETESVSEESTSENEEAEGAESREEPAKSGFVPADYTDTEASPYLVRANRERNGLYGYVDVRTGEFVIEPQFTYADIEFADDGWACVTYEDETKTVINTSGEPLFERGTLVDRWGYEGDCLVVKKEDGTCHLYHGTEYVTELKGDDSSLTLAPANAYAKDLGSYDPDRFICLVGRHGDSPSPAGWFWFDANGKLIYKSEKLGTLAGDETGYYHFGDGEINKIDLDGNVTETILCKADVRNVAYDGDTWYAMADSVLYTNGFTPVATKPTFNSTYNVFVGDGIIKIGDMYLNSNHERFYSFSTLDYSYGFQNGYAKVDAGGLGAWGGDFCGYIDVDGNPVYEIPCDDNFDSYTSILKDGYFIYGENDRYGIKNLDGRTILEPSLTSLYTRENGRHA
jgi:hypothetical protein